MILDLNLLNPNKKTMDNKNLALLELAADDNVERFKLSVENDPSAVDEGGPWYRRRNCSNLVALDRRTPLMVAAAYGSLGVLRLILAASDSAVNRSCGEDQTTALHCAASGGSTNAVETVRLLLSAGADAGAVDADGNRPGDVVMVSPGLYDVKAVLEELLGKKPGLRVATSSSSTSSPVLSSSLDEDADSLSPSSGLASPPLARKDGPGRKEYPVDPSFPDIKNGIYASDEFRMFSFKVRPCSRAYSHDWTECPFVHPGENARRRDPRKYHYSCVPCPDFRKGACKKGNMCEYGHGVFECWLHPAQYRTRICKDGTACARRICFFAHTEEELRPLYVSTGSVVQPPRSSASAVEMAAAVMSSMMPVSPSSLSVMSQNPFPSPVSPSTNGMGVPTLHLPGSNYSQSSRLRSSLSARDMPVDELTILSDFDEFCLKSSQARIGSFAENRTGRSMTINTPNLDEFSSSPRYNPDRCAAFSPSHKAPVLNQFQQQLSSFSPTTMDTQLISGYNPLLHASSRGISLPGRMSPRCIIDAHSPPSSRISQFSQQEKLQQPRSLGAHGLGSPAAAAAPVGSPVSSTWTKWGSQSGKPDWGVNGEELGQFRQSATAERGSGGKEPDVSWVQSLVNPPDGSNSNVQPEGHAVLGAWLDQPVGK